MQAYAVQPLDPWQEERLERAYAADGRRKMKVCVHACARRPMHAVSAGLARHSCWHISCCSLSILSMALWMPHVRMHVSATPPIQFTAQAVVTARGPMCAFISIHSLARNRPVPTAVSFSPSADPPFIYQPLDSRAQVQALAEELGVDRVRVLGWAKEFAQRPAG